MAADCGAAARVWLFCVGSGVHGAALTLGLLALTGACGKAPQGGAVELSWALRDQTEGFVGCGDTAIAYMRLSWSVTSPDGIPVDDAGPELPRLGSDFWPCNNNDERHGVTGFEVPEGEAMFTVTPECAFNEPALASHFRAPPPIPRNVVLGEIVTLGALVIEIDKDAICQPLEAASPPRK